MVKRLDETRDYAFVHGSENGAKYLQDGFWFDSEKNVIPHDRLNLPAPTPPEEADKPVKAEIVPPEGNDYDNDKIWKLPQLRIRHETYFGKKPPAGVTRQEVIDRIKAHEAGEPDPGLPSQEAKIKKPEPVKKVEKEIPAADPSEEESLESAFGPSPTV